MGSSFNAFSRRWTVNVYWRSCLHNNLYPTGLQDWTKSDLVCEPFPGWQRQIRLCQPGNRKLEMFDLVQLRGLVVGVRPAATQGSTPASPLSSPIGTCNTIMSGVWTWLSDETIQVRQVFPLSLALQQPPALGVWFDAWGLGYRVSGLDFRVRGAG